MQCGAALLQFTTEVASDGPDPGFSFRGGTGVPGADFEAYRAFYSGGGDVFLEAERFSADISAVRLDGCILFDRRISGVRHERGPARVDNDRFRHFTIQLGLSGLVEVDIGSGWSPLAEGEAVLLDMRRPMRIRFVQAHLLTISLARDLVVAAAGFEPEHGRRVPIGRTAALRTAFESFDPANGPKVLLAALEALTPEAALTTAARRQQRGRLQAAMVGDWIDANLHRRDIRPEGAARACGLSRAGLYRLTAPQGGLMTMVRKRRLARLERWLARGDRRGLREMAEALGFADASQLVRQFRAAAGVSPGRYRAGGAEARLRWAAWMGELR